VAAICLAIVLELAGLPSIGNDLKMIAIRPDNEGDLAVHDRGRHIGSERVIRDPWQLTFSCVLCNPHDRDL